MNGTERYVRDRLFSMQDLKYRDFHARLMPTVDKERVIGVRTPDLRRFAKEFARADMAADFLNTLPHKYYEENNLHAFLLCEIKDYDELIFRLNEFLPYVDNWATCDMMRPKVFKKYTSKLLAEIEKWMQSDKPYTVRFGIEMLMLYFLEENFKPEFPEKVAGTKSDEYYVKMMVAWYFATALAYRYDEILPFVENKVLDPWTHNKVIQKAVESYRITDEQKEYLKTLKIKNPARF
ncbi:MAG: DNA alkylation repair protein [Clostridia bacterium]|nr:DNA alkylation repair protein [Clostridia bacterium]